MSILKNPWLHFIVLIIIKIFNVFNVDRRAFVVFITVKQQPGAISDVLIYENVDWVQRSEVH